MPEPRRIASWAPFWAVLLAAPAGMILVAAVGGTGSLPDAFFRLVFHPFCHQLPERTLVVAGRPLIVCARCTGFYAGLALAGGAAALLARLHAWTRVPTAPLLLLLPLAVDGAANFLGLWHTPSGIRVLTGSLAALPLPLLLYRIPDVPTGYRTVPMGDLEGRIGAAGGGDPHR